MRLEYLREFIYLAECLNMTETANRFYLTQPALSKHLSALETEYGASLIERSTHGCRLTSEGSVVHDAAMEMLAINDAAYEKIRMIKSGLSGTIRIGSIFTGSTERLSNGLNRFYGRYPSIVAEFSYFDVQDMLQALKNDLIDVAYTGRYQALPPDEYSYTFVCDVHLRAYVGKRHPFSKMAAISIQDLGRTSVIYPRSTSSYMDEVISMLKKSGLTDISLSYCDSFEMVPFLVSKNDSCLIASNDESMQHRLGPDIVMLDFDDCSLDIPVYLVCKKSNSNPCIEHFLSTWRKN